MVIILKVINIQTNNRYLILTKCNFKQKLFLPFLLANLFLNNEVIYVFYYKNYINTFIKIINNLKLSLFTEQSISLKLIGLGYKVYLKKCYLYFILGYNHLIQLKIIPTMNFHLSKDSKIITITTNRTDILGNFLFVIKIFKKIEIYKGKGICNIFEKFKLKLNSLKKFK